MLRLLCLFGLLAFSFGCAHGTDKQLNPKESADIRTIITDYNMKLKWGMYDSAALYIAPAKRQEFLGFYEEKGEDYKIVSLEIKAVTMADADNALIEVEQEAYDSSMVVKKKRFIEYWSQDDGNWMRGERITKKEYRKRKQEVINALTASKKADTDDTDDSDASEVSDEPTEPDSPDASDTSKATLDETDD